MGIIGEFAVLWKGKQRVISLLIIVFMLLLTFGEAIGLETPAGKIVLVSGQVDVYSSKSQIWKAASNGQMLLEGDVIQTGSSGRAAVLLADETLLQVNRNSKFLIKQVKAKAGWDKKRQIIPVSQERVRSEYRLERGESWFRNKNRNINIRIETPTIVAAIRGTEINFNIRPDDTVMMTVLEGRAQASNDFGSLDVLSHEQVTAHPNQPPVKVVLLTPEDAVQWTIPIPPLFDDSNASQEVREAFQILLAGNVKKTQSLMAEFSRHQPEQSSAWSLYAIASLMAGQKSIAIEAAQNAVKTDLRSVSALLSLSYAYQAFFDLDLALEATQKALALDGNNVPALVQYAQLRFGMDYTAEARRTIDKAYRLAPENGYVQNIMGFILLAENKTKEAISAFRRAVELDATLSEPHMGLAIALMREGEVEDAFEEMSTAVLLDPRRSLFLSYWAKILYQIDRYDRALDMLNVAKELDPRDPTPELYRAIALRDLNRPAEAIEAMNHAISLNGNRAVYRSQFLLDRDLAVKNVDLSLLYSQLGLADWARSKALASVKQDYTNSSAHLFLAGSLQGAEDRSWSMQNEFLLARLLMPANMNSFNTFNEYTSFFDRPSLNANLFGTIGSVDRIEGSIIPYGAIPAVNLAFGAQLSYAEDKGWRDTNGERTGNIATLVKWNATPADGLMGVFSYQKAKQKDKSYPRFEYGNPASPNDWIEDGITHFEAGYHRHFSPPSDLLFHFTHMKYDGESLTNLNDPIFGRLGLWNQFKQPYDQIQGQYIHKIGHHRALLGVAQYWGKNDMDSVIHLYNLNITTVPTIYKKNNKLQSYYIQDTWRINSLLTVEGALYYDRMKNSDASFGTDWAISEWSPRLGLILTPSKADTFHLAAYSYLLPFISSRLDPTDIGGVTILRNHFPGSVVKEGDFIWEHEWSSGFISTNLFYVDKFYDHNIIDTSNNPLTLSDYGRIKGGEVKWNQLVWSGIGFNMQYRYQDIEDDSLYDADREDHFATAGMRYVHANGISVGAGQSYRHIRFVSSHRDNEVIWITDVSAGYEFPYKRGSINIECRNVFNHHFNWVTDYFVMQGRTPAREISLTVSLNF